VAEKRILIVKLSSLGDLFHALPAVHNLRVQLNAEVDWVTQSDYVELVRCFTDVNRVIPFARRAVLRGLRPLVRGVRQTEYDLVVDLQGLLKSAFVARLARTRKVIGPSFHREGATLLYTAVAGRRDKNRHAVEENLDVVRYLGLAVMPPEFPIRFPEAATAQPAPRIGLVPVSRWPAKNWAPESFAEAARRLQKEAGATIYLFGGPSDAATCERIAASLGPAVVNVAGRTTLVEMGGLFATMHLVIANDSGPLHMAAAVGVPVLGVYGPTDARRTGPYGPKNVVVAAPADCRPCFRRTCKRAGTGCMADIRPAQVFDAAMRMLGK
jgi:heptosyltransferase I